MASLLWWWPTDVRLQLLISVGLVIGTMVLASIPWLRHAAFVAASVALRATRVVAAGVIWLFDKVMPVNGRNGRLPRVNFAVWIALNVAIVAAWILCGAVPEAAHYTFAAAMTSVAFAVLNLLLLGASYWAIRETIEVTNGETALGDARFPEASPSRNVIFVLGTAVLLCMQFAVVVDWLQQAEAIDFISYDGSIGPRYLNFLLATIDALPMMGFYVAPLHDHVAFTANFAGQALHRTLAAAGSILIVSTALGLVQQRLVFQRMVDALLKSSEFPPALLERFKNAPDAIKGYLVAAFRSETNEERRLRLARLAIEKQSYRFPRIFAADYGHYGVVMREEGTRRVGAFLDDPKSKFDEATLQGLLGVCDWGVHRGFKTAEEKRRMARIIVPSLERLLQLSEKSAEERIVSVPAQRVLTAALGSDEGTLRSRAARLLVRGGSCWVIPPLLRALPDLEGSDVRLVLSGIGAALRKKGNLPASKAKARELLENISKAAQGIERKLPQSVADSCVGMQRQIQSSRDRLNKPSRKSQRPQRNRTPPAVGVAEQTNA